MDHPKGLHDDCANALCGSLIMALRNEALRTPPPSLGILEDVEPGAKELERESIAWLLNNPPKKKKLKPGEIDMNSLEDEIYQWEEEFEKELRNKDKGRAVIFRNDW